MTLEPLAPSSGSDDIELRRTRVKFFASAAVSIPLVLVSMGPHILKIHTTPASADVLRWMELALASPLVLWTGASYYVRGCNGHVSRSPNMYTLIEIGVLVAFIFSLVATLSCTAAATNDNSARRPARTVGDDASAMKRRNRKADRDEGVA